MIDNRQETQWSALEECINNRKLYLWSAVLCILIGFIVAFSMPIRYAAQVKIVDENFDAELYFHVPNWDWQKLSERNANLGQEDIEIFATILNSREFLKEMSTVQVPGKNQTYGEYLNNSYSTPWTQSITNIVLSLFGDYSESERTLDILDELITYSSVVQYALVTIQVSDSDPYIAACMADSVRQHLSDWLIRYRNKRSFEDIRVARNVVAENKADYCKAVKKLSDYADSHLGADNSPEVQSELEVLRNDVKRSFDVYSIAYMELTRAESATKQSSSSFAVYKSATVPLDPIEPSYFAYIISFLVIGWVFTTWYILYRKVRRFPFNQGGLFHYFSPWFLTVVVWIAIMIFTQMQNDVLYPVNSQFTISLTLWLPIFLVSSIITYTVLPSVKDTDRACVEDVPINKILFNALWGISLIITPLYLYTILKIITQFDLADMLYNIRLLAVHGNESYGFLNYCFVINQALFLTAVWQYPKMKLWKLLTIYAVNIMSCFAIMEKGGFFLIVLSTMFVLFQRGIIKVRSIVIGMCVLVVVFFAINLMRSEQSTSNTANELTFIDFFAIYVLSPPVAFGRLQQDLSGQFGSHTFEVIYLFLNRFGGHFELNQKLQDFVYVPLPTNVYTIFQPFYQDFGYKGVAFFAMIYGIASAVFYRMFRNGSGFGRCIYTYFVYVLILQFYQENIMLSLVFFTQLVFFVWLMHQQKFKFTFLKKRVQNT